MKKTTSLALLLCAACSSPNLWGGTLLSYYEMAIDSDLQLRIAQSNRNVANELRPQALAGLLPQLSLDGSASRTRRDEPLLKETYESRDLSLSVSQVLFNFGQWMRLDQSVTQTAAAQAEFDTAKLNLMVRVAEAYFAVLSAQDNLNFANAEIKAIGRQLEQARERYHVGVVTINDVYEAQAAHDQAKSDKVAAETSVENAWEALRVIIGRYPSRRINRLRSHLPMTPPKPANIDKWTAMAMERNTEILAMRKRAESSRQGIRIERSGHLPTLNLKASVSDSLTDYSQSSDAEQGSISVQLSLPLYSGGLVSSKSRQAQYDYQRSLQQLELAQREAHQAVRDAYRAMLSSISRARALAATKGSTENALEATKAGFDVGTRTMSDVLSQQRSLFRARRDHLRSQYDYILSGLRLKKAAGMLKHEDVRLVDALLSAG
jgi:outer membrane protein